MKKAVQIRPDHVEKYDQIAYKKKAHNINLKKKILPSLFAQDPKEESNTNIEANDNAKDLSSDTNDKNNVNEEKASIIGNTTQKEDITSKNISKLGKKNKNDNSKETVFHDDTEKELESLKYPQNVVKKNNKSKNKKKKDKIDNPSDIKSQKQKRKRKISLNGQELVEVPRKKINKGKKQNKNVKELAISDARLSAYGINPKKFKNKLKFGNK